MKVPYRKAGDPHNHEFVAEVCHAAAPFIKHGQGVYIAAKAGVSHSVPILIKNTGSADKVLLSLDMVLRVLPHLDNGPRVFALCNGAKYDITGLEFTPILRLLQAKIEGMMKACEYNYHEVERITGIARKFLAQVHQKKDFVITSKKILTALETLYGAVELELHDPASEVRVPRTVALDESLDPYAEMVSVIRKACNRNIKFMELFIKDIAEEAEEEIAVVQGFLMDIPTALTLSRILDIAKACKCEMQLSIR